MPRRYLYYHALELYLKALLRQKHNVETIREFGHNIKRLVKEAETLGLLCTEEDREVFAMMAETNTVIEARYIRTGFKQLPTFAALDGACDRIRASVGDTLSKQGGAEIC